MGPVDPDEAVRANVVQAGIELRRRRRGIDEHRHRANREEGEEERDCVRINHVPEDDPILRLDAQPPAPALQLQRARREVACKNSPYSARPLGQRRGRHAEDSDGRSLRAARRWCFRETSRCNPAWRNGRYAPCPDRRHGFEGNRHLYSSRVRERAGFTPPNRPGCLCDERALHDRVGCRVPRWVSSPAFGGTGPVVRHCNLARFRGTT